MVESLRSHNLFGSLSELVRHGVNSVSVRKTLEVDRQMTPDDVSEHFLRYAQTDEARRIFDGWKEGRSEYRFPVAVLLSVLPLSALHPESADLFRDATRVTSSVSVKPYHDVWALCPTSEERLGIAMREKIVAGVYDMQNQNQDQHLMIVKGTGRLTGLCTTTFITPKQNVFVEGVWYSPTDRKHHEAYDCGLDEGVGRFSLDGSEWALMRASSFYGMESYRRRTFPPQFPNADRIERQSLRARHIDKYANR